MTNIMTNEEAIEVLKNDIEICTIQQEQALDMAIKALEEQQKKPLGKWIFEFADNGWADHICSVCGYTENTDVHVHLNWNYCPNCGAKMEVSNEKK